MGGSGSAPGGGPLERARQHVERLSETLEHTVDDARAAHATVAGVYDVVDALAGLVGVLMERVPAVVPVGEDSYEVSREAVADLRALHGCLTTGALLLEPALEDLGELAGCSDHARPAPVPSEQAPSERARD